MSGVRSPYIFFPDPNFEQGDPKVLVVANLYPHPGAEYFGTFVYDEVQALRRLGVGVDVFYVNGRAGKLNYFRSILPFRRQVQARDYDVVHMHYGLTGLVACWQTRVPLVVTLHGIEVVIPGVAFISRLCARQAAALIVTSRWVAEHVPRPPDAIIPPGVDLDLFRPMDRDEARRALGLPLNKELVLFAGQPRPEKRVPVIQAAVRRLQDEGRNVEFVMASGIPHEQVPLYMNAADVLVLVSDVEGSPMVIKEAMACNLPIVTRDLGDTREIIGDTEGCFFCDGSVEGTAEAIAQALDFGRRTDGRERVRHLSLEAAARQVLGVYEKVKIENRR